MNRVAVVAPLRYGAYQDAKELIESGPPFDPTETPLVCHEVFLSDTEVVFVFEGPDVGDAVAQLAVDPSVRRAAGEWADLLAGKPRIADESYRWSRAERDVQAGLAALV